MPAPLYPDASWFEPPAEGIPTDRRFSITDEGRVYGYVSLWNSCHAGMPGCVRPPRNSVGERVHQGETITASGEALKTAVIAGGTVHAAIEANDPAEHYMNTGKQLMRVRYGEDETGLWFAGALMPDSTDFDVAHIRASSLSGDWRWHAAWRRGASGFEFMGSCLVNIPGYPVGESSIGRQPGRRFTVTASASGDTIVMDEIQDNANAEPEGDTAVSEENECEDCTDPVIEALESAAEAITAAMQYHANRKVKKKEITADASEEEAPAEEAPAEDEPDPLVEALASANKRIDDLEASVYAAEATKPHS